MTRRRVRTPPPRGQAAAARRVVSAPLLLSPYVQAQLGIAKDLRTSPCGIRLPSDDNLIKVQVCRTHDSGLLCINISEGLLTTRQPRLILEFKIPSPPVPTHRASGRAFPQQAHVHGASVGNSSSKTRSHSSVDVPADQAHANTRRRVSIAFPNHCMTVTSRTDDAPAVSAAPVGAGHPRKGTHTLQRPELGSLFTRRRRRSSER